mgnify:CR=1 FL=1
MSVGTNTINLMLNKRGRMIMSKENFKVKIVEFLTSSEKVTKAFGEVGREFEVKNGVLTDLNNEVWGEFEDVEVLISYFETEPFGFLIKFEEVKENSTFKIALENASIDWLGEVGHVFEVVNGVFKDIDGHTWSNNGRGFHDVEEINQYFEDARHDNPWLGLIRFSEYKEAPSFKVIVTNVKKGTDEHGWFGDIGTVLSVVHGELIDLQGFNWNMSGDAFMNLDDINEKMRRMGVQFEIYDEKEGQPYSGKFRVVNNVGYLSREIFGGVGTIIEVIDGTFKSRSGAEWNNGGASYKSLQEIREHIGTRYAFETIIEEVENKESPTFEIEHPKSPLDMTIEEIEAILGHKIRIVSSK